MTQQERDKAVLDPLINQLSAEMSSLGHLTYVITVLAQHYVPVPASRMNVIGIYGTLMDCVATFYATHLSKPSN